MGKQTANMSIEKYQNARNNALKMMTLGLVFLIFLPVGIPVSLIIIPFLAGRAGAKKLPSNWHLTYILTVGGGWAIGLVVGLFVLLSLALGPSLKINIAEPLIFGMMIVFTCGSFTIGVRSTRGLPENIELDEEKWTDEDETGIEVEEDEDLREIALAQETEDEKESVTGKLKSFFGGSKKKAGEAEKEKGKTKKPRKAKSSPKGKPSRVSALASRRRK